MVRREADCNWCVFGARFFRPAHQITVFSSKNGNKISYKLSGKPEDLYNLNHVAQATGPGS
jgi:hypothetical protein